MGKGSRALKVPMVRWVRWVAIITLLISATFFAYQLQSKAKKWVTTQVINVIKKKQAQLGVRIRWESLSISWIPLRINIKNITFRFPNRFLFAEPITSKQLIISPDYMHLLKKRLTAKITALQARMVIQPSQKKNANGFKVLTQKYTTWLKNIPLVKLSLKSAHLIVHTPKESLETQNIDIQLLSRKKQTTLKMEAPIIQLGKQALFSLKANIALKPDMIFFKDFLFHNPYSLLKLSGQIKGDFYKKQLNSSRLKIKIKASANDFLSVHQLIHPQAQALYKGVVSLTADMQYRPNPKKNKKFSAQNITGDFNFSTKNFSAQNIFFSEIKAVGNLKNKKLYFDQFYIQHLPSWDIRLTDFKIHLEKPYFFKTHLRIKNSQLYSLLKAVNISSRVSSLIDGGWNCQGRGQGAEKKPTLNCNGEAQIQQLSVRYKATKKKLQTPPILKVPSFNFKNQISMEKDILTAQTVAFTDTSLLDGNYRLNLRKKDFLAHLQGKLNFSDIENLVNLSPKGLVDIKNASFKISQKKLEVQSDMEGENIQIANFKAGHLKTHLTYADGFLQFNRVKGSFKKSRYRGYVHFNLFKSTIQSFADFPIIRLENITHSVEKRRTLPVRWNGGGSLTAYLKGPLKKNALYYTIRSQLSEINLEKEQFKKAMIHVESQNGHLKTHQMEFHKEHGEIKINGEILPNGNIHANIKGSHLYSNDFQNIQKYTKGYFSSNLDFDMQVGGTYLKPEAKTQLILQNSSFKGQALRDSKLSLILYPDRVVGLGQLFNELKIQKFIFPYQSRKKVMLSVNAKKFNLQPFLSGKSFDTNFQHSSHVGGEIDITYKKNHFDQSSNGQIKLNKIFLQSGPHFLQNQKPLLITLQNGKINTSPIVLMSEMKPLKITPFNKNHLMIDGSLPASLLNFLFPSIKFSEGRLQTYLKINSQLSHLQTTGQIQLKGTKVQLHPYLDPLEGVDSLIQIRNRKWEVQSLQANMGGGHINLKGDINFIRKGKIPIHIEGDFQQVHWKSWPSMSAKGDGKIRITGQKFPYKLSLIADIKSAKIKKNFSSSSSSANPFNLSPFVLTQTEKESFNVVDMDFDLNFKEPIRIQNSQMQSHLIGNVYITGRPAQPILSGKFKIQPGGEIIFRDHKFKITSGQLIYHKNKAQEPFIRLTAQTSVLEQNITDNFKNEYDILLKIKGRGHLATFTLTSLPALTENEIVSLLVFGTRSMSFQSSNSSNIVQHDIIKYSYYHLAPVLFQKAINKEFQHTLGMDFLIVPYINSKKHTVSTKLIVKKKIFNRLNVSTSQTFLDKNSEKNITAEYTVNPNASLVGWWKNENLAGTDDQNSNVLGLDLEYQIAF